MFEQPVIVPPQHEPVVIKLGPDSDDSDEDVEENEPKVGSGSGSLFGGLELMIKEARKSASVSLHYLLVYLKLIRIIIHYSTLCNVEMFSKGTCSSVSIKICKSCCLLYSIT